MRDKIVTADQAVSLVRDRDTLSSCGFVQSCVPEALLTALGSQPRRELNTIPTATPVMRNTPAMMPTLNERRSKDI